MQVNGKFLVGSDASGGPTQPRSSKKARGLGGSSIGHRLRTSRHASREPARKADGQPRRAVRRHPGPAP
eukprot:141563-Pyramimonas_sp.AAC.1